MAQVARVNGKVLAGQQVGRNFEYFTVGQTAHNDATREIIVRTLREHGSIEIVGDFGTANSFRVAMSGTNRSAAELEAFVQAADASVASATVTAFVF